MSKAARKPKAAKQGKVLAPVIDLAAGRVIPMKFGEREYTWSFRRILRSDWEKFFRSFDTEATTILGESTETFEIESGMIDLARTCVASVKGYKMPEPFPGEWRALLPLGHLRAFGWALRDVRVSASEDGPMAMTELSEISLDCTWTAVKGGMQTWSGLIHRLRPPSLQQLRAFNRACATYRVRGNDRGNTTTFPAKQALMMDFYDELIVSVDPTYTAAGIALVAREEIVAHMDASHKVCAVQGLLNAGGNGFITHAAKGAKVAQ